jgi:serine/threonine protein kinase
MDGEIYDFPQVATSLGYERHEQIGKGAFGTLYRVTRDERTYAGKFMKNTITNLNEVTVERALPRHPSLLKYIDAFSIGSRGLILILELFSGETLYNLADILTQKDILNIATSSFQGLAFSHSHNIAHRDIKLENIMYDVATKTTKIIDFGLACFADNIKTVYAGSVVYWPPEFPPPINYEIKNMDRDKKVSFDGYKRADVWALGLVLYECVNGSPIEAYSKEQLVEMNECGTFLYPQVNYNKLEVPKLYSIISQALTPDPSARPTAEEIAR